MRRRRQRHPRAEPASEGERLFIEAEREHRLEKLERLRERGVDPYPVRFDADQLHRRGPRAVRGSRVRPRRPSEKVTIAGRVMLIRRHGGLDFADVRDSSGEIQLFASLDDLGEELPRGIFRDLDLGDWVGVEGEVMKTKRGELSVRVRGLPAALEVAAGDAEGGARPD